MQISMCLSIVIILFLQPMRIKVCYWKEKTKGEYAADKFPVFFQIPAIDGYDVYGLPSEEYPGHVKVTYHFMLAFR